MFFQKTVSKLKKLKQEIRPIAAHLQKLVQASCEKKHENKGKLLNVEHTK